MGRRRLEVVHEDHGTGRNKNRKQQENVTEVSTSGNGVWAESHRGCLPATRSVNQQNELAQAFKEKETADTEPEGLLKSTQSRTISTAAYGTR